MSTIIGSTAGNQKQEAIRIRSVLLTAGAGGTSVLSVSPAIQPTSSADFIIATPSNTTLQVFFNALDFLDGVVIAPDSNTAAYVVEYEAIS